MRRGGDVLTSHLLFQNLFESSMAQCFFGHFGVSSFNVRLYVCNVGSFRASSFSLTCSWYFRLKKLESFANLRPTSPEALCSKGTWIQHGTVEPSNCNICCRTRRYNCRAVASDELTGWESYSLSYLLVLSTIPLSVIQIRSPFFFHLLFPTFSLLFLRLLFTTEVITSQFSSLTVLQRFLISCTQGTQQWRCSKARCLQIPRLWVKKNTANHKCRPFLLQAVSAKKKVWHDISIMIS